MRPRSWMTKSTAGKMRLPKIFLRRAPKSGDLIAEGVLLSTSASPFVRLVSGRIAEAAVARRYVVISGQWPLRETILTLVPTATSPTATD